MNKNEYLQELRNGLGAFSKDERDSAIAYYEEFFEEAGFENEEAVIASLGNPKALAESILKESGVNSSNSVPPVFTPPMTPLAEKSSYNSGSSNSLFIILIILSFPLWIGFVAGAFGILVAVITTAFALMVSFSVASAVLLGVGFISLFFSPPVGIVLIGVGLVVLGLTILFVFPIFRIFIAVCNEAFKGIGKIFKSIFGRKGVA